MPRPATVRSLALAAGIDVDEALVSLWDNGIDSVLDPDDVIPQRALSIALRALEIPTGREQSAVSYWLELSGLTRAEFVAKVAEAGITIKPDARKVPKNGVRKLRRIFIFTNSESTGLKGSPAAGVNEMPPLIWETVGSTCPEQYLTEEAVLEIHAALEEDFRYSPDPITPEGVRDPSLLSSALARPTTSFGDTEKYPTVEMAGAALLHSLVHNHAFHNGNKRTALVGLLVFLDLQGMVFTCNEEDLFKFLIRVGQHSIVPIWADDLADREVMEIAKWIRSQTRKISKEELPLKWLKLKQRLRDFGCEYNPAPGKGNRLDIWRDVPVAGRFRPKTERLTSQVYWGGDGTEAEKNTTHEIRRALHLDADHDVDSETFYQGATVDAFIIQYRGILGRLAKF